MRRFLIIAGPKGDPASYSNGPARAQEDEQMKGERDGDTSKRLVRYRAIRERRPGVGVEERIDGCEGRHVES